MRFFRKKMQTVSRGSEEIPSLLHNLVDAKVELSAFRKNLQKDWQKLYQKSFSWIPSEGFSWDFIPELKGKRAVNVGYFSGEAKWAECNTFPPTKKGWSVCYPRIVKEELHFSKCSFEDLVPSSNFDIMEAPAKLAKCKPHFLFVPASAVDREGKRIGKGGGYYDGFLRKNPKVISCVVIHSRYLFDHMPNRWFHSGDERVQYILTEKEFINIKESSS